MYACMYACGRAEQTLRDVLRAHKSGGFGQVVGVVDPPRSGLHHDVIKSLRKCRKLEHLIYVSCNPSGSFLEDAVALCAPVDPTSGNQLKNLGQPFRPIHAVPVDLFPHTDHCEMVVVFSRLQHKKKKTTPAATEEKQQQKQQQQQQQQQQQKEQQPHAAAAAATATPAADDFVCGANDGGGGGGGGDDASAVLIAVTAEAGTSAESTAS